MKHKGTQTLDNEICQMMCGAIALLEGNAKEAELIPYFIAKKVKRTIKYPKLQKAMSKNAKYQAFDIALTVANSKFIIS